MDALNLRFLFFTNAATGRGGVLYLRYWLARERYWLARLTTEQEQQTQELVAVLRRIETLLGERQG